MIYALVYHFYFDIKKTPAELYDEMNKKNFKTTASQVALLLFGLGLFITVLHKRHIGVIIPYIICAIMFGTLTSEILNNLVLDHYNLERMLNISTLAYCFLMLSYGFLIMSLYLTLFFYVKIT
jgi:hypothetical protein